MTTEISAEQTHVFPRMLDLSYPLVERGQGVWLELADGRKLLDACSGGAMVTCLGHGRAEIADAAAAQAERIAYMYNHFFTNDAQERLAAQLIEIAAPEMARVRFVSGGSEANETMIRIMRQYHVDRGEPERWRIISQAQSYHGATMGALALTGRGWLQRPFESYLPDFGHIAPSTWRFDPSGAAALDELDRQIEQAGPGTIAAFVCEPVSAAALPGYTAPDKFWLGLDERRKQHGFLVCFDEIVTGLGRTGTWFAYQQLPIVPDVVTAGKGLGAGYAPLAAALCRQHIFDAIAANSGELEHGHTWDGAPLPCAVGLAVMDHIVTHDLVERVRARGPSLHEELRRAVGGLSIVREVRGRGFLLGVELVDPRDPTRFLPAALDVAELIDKTCEEKGLLVTSSHSSLDKMVGDQTLLAPAFNATDAELAEMVSRFAVALAEVQARVEGLLEDDPA
ncbi:MAG: aspartate aminotransferase family protein [Steroidobacteraceae bacterium]